MPDEDKEKMKKMRTRIDRDAYSVLLSFKDGASPRQVETRMDETLGYTYNGKYHLAGVYDMSQILREHPQVRRTADGKFKVIANEDNHELVALISKQKDNKRKKGGNSGRGRRAATSLGYHHNYRNGFGQGLAMKSSPRANIGLRPATSMTKYNYQKPVVPATNPPRPTAPNTTGRFSLLRPKFGVANKAFNQSFNSGNTQKNDAAPAKSSAPSNPFPGQRPLLRTNTATTSNSSFISQDSTFSDTTQVRSSLPSPQSHPTGHMPSIKEFTGNAKNMMLSLHPESIHLSEMTDLYSQEYGVTVEPLQLFSKSWMNLVKTTFKDWLQMDEGVVSLKPDWFNKYGAALKRSIASKKKSPDQPAVNSNLNRSVVIPAPNTAVPKSNVPIEVSDPFSPLNSTLPSNQGFRYKPPPQQISTNKSTGLTTKMKHLLVGRRQTPEKTPGLKKSPAKNLEISFKNNDSFSTETESILSSQLPKEPVKRVLSGNSFTEDPHYDARQLRSLKFVEKHKDLISDVETALNGKEDPQLNKIVKKKSKASYKPRESPPNTSFSSKPVPNLHVNATSSSVSDQVRSSPTKGPLRSRFTGMNSIASRLVGQAINALRKQAEDGPRPQQTLYTVPSVATPVANKKNEVKTETNADFSDDGWNSPDSPKKRQTPPKIPTASRQILLPPMSKGPAKDKVRSRPASICKSMTSQDGVWLEKALQATLPDDDAW